MNHQRASSSLGCFLLLLLLPLYASAAPKDPCKLLQRDLDQQIDDLKAWQKLDLQECSRISGSDSDECRQLKERHAQDLRSFRDNRAYQVANCRGYGTRSVAAAPVFDNSHNDFYETYYSNLGNCVEYPYVDCSQYDRYVHRKLHHHHHHYYSEPSYGGAKSAYTNAGKPSTTGSLGNTGKNAKQDGVATRSSAHDSPAQSAHRGSDRDNSSNHGSGRADSSSAASSARSRDSGGSSYSGGSHTSGGSASSAGSSSSGASHSSGGGGSSSSGSSSSGATYSGSASSASLGASASSSASSPSHDSGGSRPK
jgi:hypothetical protein